MQPLWNLPYPRHPFFTGGDDILAQLFQGEFRGTAVQALTGLCGIGKTQIALEYAYRHQEAYSVILWLNASSRQALSTDLRTITLLNDVSEDLLFEGFKLWLADQQDWLLVLDRLEDLQLIEHLISYTSGGHVLLTTRGQATGTFARAVPVLPMSVDIGALFLLRRTGNLSADASLDDASSDIVQEAITLAQELEGLPLALDQAGAYIKETGCNLADYRVLYQKEKTLMLGSRGQPIDGCHLDSVSETLVQIYTHLPPPARELLRLFTFFPPDVAIPDALHGSGLNRHLRALAADTFAFHDALADLLCFSLLVHHPETRELTLHPLVRVIIRSQLSATQQQFYARQAASFH